jgi:hypothetical protein
MSTVLSVRLRARCNVVASTCGSRDVEPWREWSSWVKVNKARSLFAYLMFGWVLLGRLEHESSGTPSAKKYGQISSTFKYQYRARLNSPYAPEALVPLGASVTATATCTLKHPPTNQPFSRYRRKHQLSSILTSNFCVWLVLQLSSPVRTVELPRNATLLHPPRCRSRR